VIDFIEDKKLMVNAIGFFLTPVLHQKEGFIFEGNVWRRK